MTATPVTIVSAGGYPVTNVPDQRGAVPMTVVDALGEPVTLVDAGGEPVTLLNADGTLYSGSGPALPRALILILLGQSLNAPRNTTAQATAPSTGYRMPVKAAATVSFDFFALNALWPSNYANVATDVEFTEGALQTPLAGITTTLDGGPFDDVYLGSAAIGARTVDTLSKGGPRANVQALLKRFVSFAIADGYAATEIDVAFYSAHGEADAAAGTSEGAYYDAALEWYRNSQLLAAQALGRPTYVAPVFITYPVQNSQPSGTGANDRIIKEAIRRAAADLESGFDMGPKYQWPAESDRVHSTAVGTLLRGEFIGTAIREYFTSGSPTETALHINTVTLTGTTAVVTFNRSIARDATLNVGQTLNAANAEDGFEWFDNASAIAISSVVYSGATATLTLATTPAGTLSQQVCRIGVQNTPLALDADISDRPGSIVRAAGAGRAAIHDPAYTQHIWAAPRTFDDVTAP